MKEIKFLKDLPIKLANTNKVLDVIGGDIYYDTEGNRYGYITFKNTNKSPIFSLQLFIREYSIDGKFIKDNELFDGYCYYPRGEFVINQPVIFDKETEAIEITIVKLTFNNRNFINDRFVGFKQSDYADLYQRKAPFKKPGTGSTFNFARETPSIQNAQEDNFQVEAPVNEVAPEFVNEETPVRAPVNEVPVKVEDVNNFGKAQKDFLRFIPAAVAFVALVVLALLIMSAVTGGVNAFNQLMYSY